MSTTTPTPGRTTEPILDVKNLGVDFWVDGVWYPAAIGMNYQVHRAKSSRSWVSRARGRARARWRCWGSLLRTDA